MNIPVPDGANYEALESLVELYYQLKGYITSSGKWISKGRDIDVLAIGENKTVIVSVTTNLRSKFSIPKKRKNLRDLDSYFSEVQKHLNNTTEYKWLVNKKLRKVEQMVAFHEHCYKKDKKKQQVVEDVLKKNRISLLSADEIIRAIYDYFNKNLKDENQSIKSQNQIFRTLQILKRLGWFKCTDT